MEKLPASHAKRLNERLTKVGHLPIATYVVENLVPRSNNAGSVFQEGDMFSGIYQKANAQAVIIVPASPYIPPYIPTQRFIAAAEDTFEHSVKLQEGLQTRETLSPHLNVWWRDGEYSDIYSLRQLPKIERKALEKVITQAVTDGIHLLRKVEGENPRIGGSWGKASIEERRLGLSRGGPSVKEGHMHLLIPRRVAEFARINEELTGEERVSHFHPWNHIFQDEFGTAFSEVLQNKIQSRFQEDQKVNTTLTQDIIQADGRGSFMKGYFLSFSHSISLNEGFDVVIDVAEQFGNFYQSMRNFHEEYYKLLFTRNTKDSMQNNFSFADLIKRMDQQIEQIGFPADKTQSLEDFILRIRPTYGQLLQWKNDFQSGGQSTELIDREIERYSSIRRAKQESNSMQDTILQDTVKTPEEYQTIIRTWPAQFSAAYEFSYNLQPDGRPAVNGITISPVIGSLETSERIFEAIVKRPIVE